MLQQTTVATVIPYYQRWIKTFPTIEDVAKAPLQKILKSWQGLGYYGRAKNIGASAKIICNLYAAKIPNTPEVLSALPGFGPYTTGAVLSIAFDRRLPIIDANVRRVVMRVLAIKGHADTEKDEAIYSFLDKVLPQKEVGTFNQALMELGALVCRSQEPLCCRCPVERHCLARKKGLQDVIPMRRQKNIEKIEAVVGIIEDRRRFFIQQRTSPGLMAGLWEFPGGKIQKGELPKDALARELKEELGVTLVSARPFLMVKHAYTKFQVKLHVFLVEVKPMPLVDKTHRLIRIADFKKYPMPSATVKITEHLKDLT